VTGVAVVGVGVTGAGVTGAGVEGAEVPEGPGVEGVGPAGKEKVEVGGGGGRGGAGGVGSRASRKGSTFDNDMSSPGASSGALSALEWTKLRVCLEPKDNLRLELQSDFGAELRPAFVAHITFAPACPSVCRGRTYPPTYVSFLYVSSESLVCDDRH